LKKSNESNRKRDDEISIEEMDKSRSKYIISSRRISAVRDNENVQNYEDYINDKYLTGAIVSVTNWKKQKKSAS
jgi:hypothetical protein